MLPSEDPGGESVFAYSCQVAFCVPWLVAAWLQLSHDLLPCVSVSFCVSTQCSHKNTSHCMPLKGVQGREWHTLYSRETGRTGLQKVRYFQELISCSQSSHLLISRKGLIPFMVTSAPLDWQKIFCKISAWLHWRPPSPKSHILTFLPYFFVAVSQSYLRCCLPGWSPHIAPDKT